MMENTNEARRSLELGDLVRFGGSPQKVWIRTSALVWTSIVGVFGTLTFSLGRNSIISRTMDP
jgi:hypothetical protein